MEKQDRLLHSVSVTLGCVISSGWENMPKEMRDDLMMAFRNIRRHITVGEDGKRYGAAEAGRMVKGK
jgi:hypothetical protein